MPIFIRANRSVVEWTKQMETVLAADAELRSIKHEIHSSRGIPDPPFEDADAVVAPLQRQQEIMKTFAS